MAIDEEDLERAGTRSRRQLTNSKKYAIYPPEEQQQQQHRYNSLFRKPRYYLSRLFNTREKAIVIGVLFLLMLITTLRPTTLFSVRKASSAPVEEFLVEFNDSSQLTDYKQLDRLLINKKASSISSRYDNYFNVNTPGQSSFANQLAKGSAVGHTFDELRRLTNSITLPSASTGKHRRVQVTAVIHTTTVTQLYVQVQAVLTQTALPEHIWIICDTDVKQEVEARIMTLDRRRVKVMAMDEQNSSWLQTIAHVATDFVWMIDQDIVPGKRYLENLLKLSQTAQYRSALLGTEGSLINRDLKNRIECIPDTMNSGSRQMKSQVVDMVNDIWLLHRSWIPYLLEAIEKDDTVLVEPLMGLFISRSLYMMAGIPSIALPTDPIERAYWGDVRLQKTHKSETCKTLESLLDDKEMRDMIYQDMLYRGQPSLDTATSTESLLFYVDNGDDLEQLSPLICGFEAKGELDVHIVTKGLPDQQIRSSLPTLCGYKQFAIKVAVHDLGLLHQTNDALHRLTRIMSVIQPAIVIYSVDDISIKVASKIAKVSTIYLPTQDIPHVQWMTELSLQTLAEWNSFSIKLIITTDKKPHALAQLLNSANQAHYLGDRVDLSVLMDQTTDSVTQALANNYKWNKGEKNIRHRIAQTYKPSVFVEAWYPSSNDEYAIILNNEIELSPLFYIWAKYAILQYRYQTRNNSLFGVSLYAPRLLETDLSGRHLLNTTAGSEYLMQWPSYSGAVYFPEHWREFHDYITARIADNNGFEMQEVTVPGLRSSEWTRSWRRYFEELIYLRSYLMLFPKESLSTVHFELKKKAMRDQFKDAISLFNVPLAQDTKFGRLPPFDRLPILDIWGQPAEMEELQKRGLALQDEISACLPSQRQDFDPSDLLCPYSRIVSVTLENENDPLPELPTKEIHVYD